MALTVVPKKDHLKLINGQSNDKKPKMKKKKKTKLIPLTRTMKKVLAHRNFIERQRRNPPTSTPIAKTSTSKTTIQRLCTLSVQCLSSEVFHDDPPAPATTPKPTPSRSEKRKRSTTPTLPVDQTFYTKGQVVDRMTFSRQMSQIFNKAALPPPQNKVDAEHRNHISAYLEDYYLKKGN